MRVIGEQDGVVSARQRQGTALTLFIVATLEMKVASVHIGLANHVALNLGRLTSWLHDQPLYGGLAGAQLPLKLADQFHSVHLDELV